MKNRDHFLEKHKELHPRVGVGIFLIVLGLALLVATNDLLGLGSVKDYFTWETALVFIGAILLLNLQFTGGLILISIGTWFFIENRDYEIPEIVKTIYWPSVIVLVGLGFIISSLLKRINKKTNFK
jgi:phage shock protein PspC (stress-responsive transcriptional regulator)